MQSKHESTDRVINKRDIYSKCTKLFPIETNYFTVTKNRQKYLKQSLNVNDECRMP